MRAVKKLPELIERLDEYYPPRGARASVPAPARYRGYRAPNWWAYALTGVVGAAIGAALLFVLG